MLAGFVLCSSFEMFFFRCISRMFFEDASAKICSQDLIFTGSLAEDLPPAHAEVTGSPLVGGEDEEGVGGFELSL